MSGTTHQPGTAAPLDGRESVARAMELAHPELTEAAPDGAPRVMDRRAGDRAAGHPAHVPAYDPWTARRRRRPDWLVTFVTRLVGGDAAAGAAGAALAVQLAAQLGTGLPGDLVWAAAAGWPALVGLSGGYADRRLGIRTRGVPPGADRRGDRGGGAGRRPCGRGRRRASAARGPDPGDPGAGGAGAAAGDRADPADPHAGRRLYGPGRGRVSRRVVVVGREAGLLDLTARLRRETRPVGR